MKSLLTTIRQVITLAVLGLAVAGGVMIWRHLTANATVEQLLAENASLKEAIANLTEETQIGYAKVLGQETRDGQLFTRILFVETDPQEMTRRVLEKQFEIEGDVAHFDALIVKFTAPLVMDGRQRAIYLWRRVYGEKMTPEEGFILQTPQGEPLRYAALGKTLSLDERQQFWDAIWGLSNNLNRLQNQGIQALFGNVVYKQLRPGLIYIFKINNSGSIYPEMIPEL